MEKEAAGFGRNKDKRESQKRWLKIGAEVYLRKTVLFAAMEDLKKRNIENPLALAATDVFVEKTQAILTRRGQWLFIWGGLCTLGALLGFVFAIIFFWDWE